MLGPDSRLPSSILSIATVCLLAWRASAQIGGYNMAYVAVDEHTLYIPGGATHLSAPNELYALDLTRSWNTSQPLWSLVPLVGTYAQQLPALSSTMTFSHISQTLTTWDFTGSSVLATNYRLRTGAIEVQLELPTPALNVSDGFMAAIEPATDRVYIPGAYPGGLMLDYDLTSKTLTSQPMPVKGDNNWNGYTLVWNEVRKSFFLWGGKGPSDLSYFFEYKPRSVTPWAELQSFGARPRPLSESCMVSAHGGTKMLLFGGHSPDLSTFSKILYILDVPSMTWTQEPGPVTLENRARMACVASGDSFIALGGYRSKAVGEKETAGLSPLIYDFVSRNWTTTFVPGRRYSAPQKRDLQGSAISEPWTDKSESNNAAIIGGAAVGGVFVVILTVVTLVMCRRRRRWRRQEQIAKDEGSQQVCDKERSSSPQDSNDQEYRFNNKEPVELNAPQEIKIASSSNKLPEKTTDMTHTNRGHTPCSCARVSKILELDSPLNRPSQSPHSIDPLPTPRSTISPSSTIYGVYAAPTLINSSEPIRSVTSTSKHHMQKFHDQSNNPNMHTTLDNDRCSSTAPHMSGRRPQDHSESTRSNGERTLTTVEQLEVLHEEMFAMNAEMGRLRSSLN